MTDKTNCYNKGKPCKRKTVRKRSSRILLRAKISDYKLKKIIRCYSKGLTAAQTHERVNVSTTRIYAIFGLIRKRMIMSGIYPNPLKMLALAKVENLKVFEEKLIKDIEALKSERRGIRSENMADYAAEAAYRLLNGDLPDQQHYDDIMLAIRYAGPLNATRQPNARYADIKALRHISQLIPSLTKQAPRHSNIRKYMNELLEYSLLIEQKPGIHKHRHNLPILEEKDGDKTD